MDVHALGKLYELEGPFTTIYLSTPSDTEDAAGQLEIRWKNALRELADAGVDAATRDALTEHLGPNGRGGTRVMIATPGQVHLAISLPQPPAQEIVTVEALPRLVPLLDAMTFSVPHVLVLADRKGADVLAFTAGPDPVEETSVVNHRFPDRKVHGAGWATKRYSNDVEETWEQSAREVAALVDRVARDIQARVVITSGDEHAVSLIRGHLPAPWVDRFVEIGGGGRHVDGSQSVIADEVQQVLAAVVRSDTQQVLEKYAEERGQHDRASEGVEDTITALRMNQVETLILTDLRDADATVWIGPDTTHVALTEAELRDLGVDKPARALLDEALARAALGTDAGLRVVDGALEQSPEQGVGAILRYTV
jgi:hypothetical protein